jgi:hypothetical protein
MADPGGLRRPNGNRHTVCRGVSCESPIRLHPFATIETVVLAPPHICYPQRSTDRFDPRRRCVQDQLMQPAIRSIVDIYVRLGNRKALDDLRASRERLIAGLKTLGGGYDPSMVIAQFADEIALIDAGLAKLNKAA